MSIINIDIYSSEYKRMIFKPSVSFSGMTVSVYPGDFEYDGHIYHLDEQVNIDIPEITEDSYVKIYFVEDISTKELLVVTDFLTLSNFGDEWIPDPAQHKILFKFVEGTM